MLKKIKNYTLTYIKNFNINIIPIITVVMLISFAFPVNNFNTIYETTPNTIPSDML